MHNKQLHSGLYRTSLKRFFICLLLASISGCASYSQSFKKVELLLSQQKPHEALLELEKHPNKGKNELLYLLDKAMLQRMSGLYAASNASFEQAKVLIDTLAATSVVEQAGALTINDSLMSYEGEDYEQVAVHVYAALNYIELGLWDEARVEALQVDERLKKIKEQNDGKSIEDAFSRYLAGLIYEQGGEYSDAMIEYRKAYKGYQQNKEPIPLFLQQDLLRLSQYLGLKDDYKAFKKRFDIPVGLSVKQLRQDGEVMVLLHHSLAPIKRAENIFVLGSKGIQHRISFPVYQSRPNYVVKARLVVGSLSVETSVVDDFDTLARKSLETHRAAMIARLIARSILKKQAAKKAERSGGGLAGMLVDVAGMVTETADTRSWLTLPKNIHFARLPIKRGIYPAKLELIGHNGTVISTLDLGSIEVQRGKKIMIERTYVAPYSDK